MVLPSTCDRLSWFHVIIGTIFIFVGLVRYSIITNPKQHFGFEAAAWYWHSVDVVWLFLFNRLYLGFYLKANMMKNTTRIIYAFNFFSLVEDNLGWLPVIPIVIGGAFWLLTRKPSSQNLTAIEQPLESLPVSAEMVENTSPSEQEILINNNNIVEQPLENQQLISSLTEETLVHEINSERKVTWLDFYIPKTEAQLREGPNLYCFEDYYYASIDQFSNITWYRFEDNYYSCIDNFLNITWSDYFYVLFSFI